ncbi:MAG: ATP-binding cassette domain-containing protein [Candidatus Bathyarchaeia archaeon]
MRQILFNCIFIVSVPAYGARMPPIIQIMNLTKKFGNLVAVDHLNLDVEEGEILGLLGPNGAGKTTTILMIATVIKPTDGTALVGGYDVRKDPDKVRELLGIAFQEPKMLWVSTPWDIVNWHAKVCGLPKEERKHRVKEVMDALEIWEYRHRNVHALSGGMRKRVEIAKVLIQRPKVAIVDEPTAQIDVVGKHKIWNMLRKLRDEGSTIILATNELYEADVLSNRVGIMHRGKLLVCDTPKKLKDSIVGGDVVEVQLVNNPSPKVIEEVKGFREVVNIVQIKSSTLRIHLNNVEEVMPRIMNMLMKKKVQISSVRMSEPSLDDVFAHYTGLTIEEAQRAEG